MGQNTGCYIDNMLIKSKFSLRKRCFYHREYYTYSFNKIA